MKKVFYITTPLYYVNDIPHIGHAYTTVLSDVIARYHRAFGEEVFFLTGTDEHGEKIASSARESGSSPIKHCNKYVLKFKALWKKLNIEYDDFIRTTEERHELVVKEILKKLYEKGDIYKSTYTGWYCTPCERFWTNKDLIEGRCPSCNKTVYKIKESNYFFKMSRYQERLLKHIKENPGFIKPEFRKNEITEFLKKPLNDLCISRPKSRLSWGIPLPFDEDYTCYVWMDALTNYISAPGYIYNNKKFNEIWPADYHFIGKDILTTHCVYWPSWLMAIGIELPRTIFAHGWWMSGEGKMSKSKGNVIDPIIYIEKFGEDAFRYFLMREMSLGQDATFSHNIFVNRINSELVNDYGNLVSRTVKMIKDFSGGKIPCEHTNQKTNQLRKEVIKVPRIVKELVKEMRLNEAIEEVMSLVRRTNRFIEETAPWKLNKENKKKELEGVLYAVSEALRFVSILLHPIIPNKSTIALKNFNIDIKKRGSFNSLDWGGLTSGTEINPQEMLFPRIKTHLDGRIDFGELSRAAIRPYSVVKVSFDDFKKLDIKIAEIKEVINIKGANKLLKLKIVIGKEERQIVAGIGAYYSPRELIGKKIVVLTNLEPRIVKGELSEGMLLAATEGDKIVLLTPDKDISSGSIIS
ncbi:methionine--tRNA ligase [candidate division WOR-3 bacterium]|nr:methionine--tRNA ligase [candidate division WOR-3 bacterium]